MRFEFATAGQIIFGARSIQEAGRVAARFGSTALVVTGSESNRAANLRSILQDANVEHRFHPIAGEPTIQGVEEAAREARKSRCQMVIGIGGGSVIDAAKAVAAMATNHNPLMEHLEVIGAGEPLQETPLPCIAIPTTAGTGAEVTRNAVLRSPDHKVKASLRHPAMLPRVAIVDPELTVSMHPSLTAATGLDALTQLIEPFVCNQPNPMTDALCREGIQQAARSLRRAVENGKDRAAREAMSLASLLGGIALANARLGAVHGLAAPLGGRYNMPHGAICGCLLPAVMEANVRALQKLECGSACLERYDRVAQIMIGNPRSTAMDGVNWVRNLVASLPIKSLGAMGMRKEDIPLIAQAAMAASSMKGNPVCLSESQLTAILCACL